MHRSTQILCDIRLLLQRNFNWLLLIAWAVGIFFGCPYTRMGIVSRAEVR